MDGLRHVGGSRRRLGGIAVVSLSVLGGVIPHWASSKKKHKKRCKKLGATCSLAGRRCCGKLVCGEAVSVERYCCRAENATCRADGDCCDGYGCFGLGGEAPFCKLA